jgi:hypothetical protein
MEQIVVAFAPVYDRFFNDLESQIAEIIESQSKSTTSD